MSRYIIQVAWHFRLLQAAAHLHAPQGREIMQHLKKQSSEPMHVTWKRLDSLVQEAASLATLGLGGGLFDWHGLREGHGRESKQHERAQRGQGRGISNPGGRGSSLRDEAAQDQGSNEFVEVCNKSQTKQDRQTDAAPGPALR